MFTARSESIFNHLLTKELGELTNVYEEGKEISIDYDTPKFVDGNILAPINPTKQSVVDLMAKYRFATPKREMQASNADTFLNTMKTSMLSLDNNVSYIEALSIIADYIEKAGSNFYGAVLRNSANHLINPLHPLTALASTESTPEGRYKLILYFYEDRTKADIEYKSAEADHSYISSNINSLLRAYSTDATNKSLCTAVHPSEKDYSVTLEFRTKEVFTRYSNIRPAKGVKEYYLSAQQVLTRGIFIPYYGSSVIRKAPEGNGEGLPISPFLAVNIGAPSSTEFSDDTAISFRGICTGSQPRSTLKGIRVLTHANLSSPMNRNTILPTALAYADHCINTSISIYNKADMLAKSPSIPTEYREPDLLAGIDPEHIKLYIENPDTFTTKLLDTSMLTGEIVNIYHILLKLDGQGDLDEYKNQKPNEAEEDDTVFNHDGQTDPRQQEPS